MRTETCTNSSNAVRRIAPEDITVNQFVVVIGETAAVFLPGSWAVTPGRIPDRVRITCNCAMCSDGEPQLVIAVCLPFVSVVDADGDRSTLDVRTHILALASEEYALEIFTRPGRSC